MSNCELKIVTNSKNLICSFGGMQLQMGGILPFEFLRYLSNVYKDVDLFFYTDKFQCWYNRGIHGITNNADETVQYLDKLIKSGNYENVIFIGTSAGGYASILFGSLCKSVNHVIAFIPQTIVNNVTYSNLKNIINKKTNYILYGDTTIKDTSSDHHILHCENIKQFDNVKVVYKNGLNLKHMRDTGDIKKILDDKLNI